MANISALAGLAPVEQLNMDEYQPNRQSTFRLPPAGQYTLRAPESFPDTAFGVSKAGALTVQIDPTIAVGEFEGTTVRFQRVSAKPFLRKGSLVSQLGDYLNAVGISGTFSTPQDLADAAEMTASQTYEAYLDWNVYNKNTGFKLEGMKNFPKLADGSYQSWVEDPTAVDADGKPVRLRANLSISRFIPRS
jgi:hypothetical protein